MCYKFISIRAAASVLALTLSLALCGVASAQMQQQLKLCDKIDEPADARIAACTAAIQSGQFSGKALATLYYDRGMAYHYKQDFTRAIADLKEAARLDPKSKDDWHRPITGK
jgi:hypothetical protein